jgi:hypothetical protein
VAARNYSKIPNFTFFVCHLPASCHLFRWPRCATDFEKDRKKRKNMSLFSAGLFVSLKWTA